MSGPLNPAPLPRGQVRACSSCRQKKVKCEGANSPPCQRCLKDGRICITPARSQPSAAYEELTPATSISSELPVEPSTELLSIYSASPVSHIAALGLSNADSTPQQHGRHERAEIPQGLLSRQDLIDLLIVFRERLLPHALEFQSFDFYDVELLLGTEIDIVYCACYVTAAFIPGAESMRQILLQRVLPLLNITPLIGSERVFPESKMRCLLLLLSYTAKEPASPHPFQFVGQSWQLKFWPVLYATQLYAFRIGLPSAIKDVVAALRESPNTSHTNGHNRYLLWLQLYLMSHYFSLNTGCPPTIRIDSSIRVAPKVLKQSESPSQDHILGQIELCLIWERASRLTPGLAEWWCTPCVDLVDSTILEATIADADSRIDSWRHRWDGCIKSASATGQLLDYHCRMTSFYISSYAIKCVQSTKHAALPEFKHILRRCISRANKLLEWPLFLSPIQKERLRYLPGSSSTMITFCCLFILSACQNFRDLISDFHQSLNNVVSIARMMLEKSMSVSEQYHKLGNILLRQVELLVMNKNSTEKMASELEPPGNEPSGSIYMNSWHSAMDNNFVWDHTELGGDPTSLWNLDDIALYLHSNYHAEPEGSAAG